MAGIRRDEGPAVSFSLFPTTVDRGLNAVIPLALTKEENPAVSSASGPPESTQQTPEACHKLAQPVRAGNDFRENPAP